MRVQVPRGRQLVELDIEPGRLIAHLHGPAPLADPAEAVRQALERPLGFPPLRRALTPGDHIAVVIDEALPDLTALLVPILEHIGSAGVDPAAITLVCAGAGRARGWVDELPDEFDDMSVEVHDPKDRQRLAYLATTRAGRRLYLNRTVVDADQVVVLTGRHYDSVLGYGGGEGDLFPSLADESTREQVMGAISTEAPGGEPWPSQREAVEVTWLLGQPFFVQLIRSAGAGIAHVVAGAIDSTREAQRLLDRSWRRTVNRRADTVVIGLSTPQRQTFADLAQAVGCASRVVRQGGRIIVLGEGSSDLGPGGDLVLHADEPQAALHALGKAALPGSAAALLWTRGVCQAHVSLWSSLAEPMVEDLFASPLSGPEEVQRLVTAGGECLVIDDGERMVVTVE